MFDELFAPSAQALLKRFARARTARTTVPVVGIELRTKAFS